MAERLIWRELTVALRHRRKRDDVCESSYIVSAVSCDSEHRALVPMTPRFRSAICRSWDRRFERLTRRTFNLDVL